MGPTTQIGCSNFVGVFCIRANTFTVYATNNRIEYMKFVIGFMEQVSFKQSEVRE